MDILTIHELAVTAAKQAEQEFMDKHGEPLYCGFAWVKFPVDGRTKLSKLIKQIGAQPDWNFGYVLWNVTGNPTQSMDIKEQGARAYAKVMNEHGIKAYAQSRAD